MNFFAFKLFSIKQVNVSDHLMDVFSFHFYFRQAHHVCKVRHKFCHTSVSVDAQLQKLSVLILRILISGFMNRIEQRVYCSDSIVYFVRHHSDYLLISFFFSQKNFAGYLLNEDKMLVEALVNEM